MVNNQHDTDENSKNSEDYSVVAQRFLNIFRQLHIFTPEKKQAFDDAILALPAEVRGNFGKLLGGSMLQEYVDELEKKTGTLSSKGSGGGFADIPAAVNTLQSAPQQTFAANSPQQVNVVSDGRTEQLLAKILETTQKNALSANQAQMQFQAQLIEAIKKLPMGNVSQVQSPANVTSQPTTPAAVTNATIAIDNNRIEETIAKLVKAQAELIANATKAQTEQLTKIIADSFKETYTNSTQSLIDTLKIMNKDSLETMRESFKMFASSMPPINVSNYNVAGSPQLQGKNFDEQLRNQQQKEIVYDKAPEEFYYEKRPSGRKNYEEEQEKNTGFLNNILKKKKKDSTAPAPVKTPEPEEEYEYIEETVSENKDDIFSSDEITSYNDLLQNTEYSWMEEGEEGVEKNPPLPEDVEVLDDTSFSNDLDWEEDFEYETESEPETELEESYEYETESEPETELEESFEAVSEPDSKPELESEQQEIFEQETEVEPQWEEKTIETPIAKDESVTEKTFEDFSNIKPENETSAVKEEYVEQPSPVVLNKQFDEVVSYDEQAVPADNITLGDDYAIDSFEEIINPAKNIPNETTAFVIEEKYPVIKDEYIEENTITNPLESKNDADDFNVSFGDSLDLDDEEIFNFDDETLSLDDDLFSDNDSLPSDENNFIVPSLEETQQSDETPKDENLEPDTEEEWEYVEGEEGDDDSDWEYVEEDADGDGTDGESSSVDYEWEYVEDEEGDGDEKWEYVEEDADGNDTGGESSSEDYEWEYVESEEGDDNEQWEWEYVEEEDLEEDEEKALIDREPITFEEDFIEPEGEYDRKPAPLSSDGILDKESIFKFDKVMPPKKTDV